MTKSSIVRIKGSTGKSMTQDPERSNDTPKQLRVKFYLYISKLRACHALRYLVVDPTIHVYATMRG